MSSDHWLIGLRGLLCAVGQFSLSTPRDQNFKRRRQTLNLDLRMACQQIRAQVRRLGGWLRTRRRERVALRQAHGQAHEAACGHNRTERRRQSPRVSSPLPPRVFVLPRARVLPAARLRRETKTTTLSRPRLQTRN